MLALAMRVINEYKVLLIKMKINLEPLARNNTSKKLPKDEKKLVKLAKKNLAFLFDIQILFDLSELLSLLTYVHSLIKFAKG